MTLLRFNRKPDQCSLRQVRVAATSPEFAGKWNPNPKTKQPTAGPIAKHSRLFGNAFREYDKEGFPGDWGTTGAKFVPNTTRGVNDYIACATAIYLYDQHPNPSITLFLGMPKGSAAEGEFADAYALSELVQWLFRSRIRCGGMNGTGHYTGPRKSATIYIPSARMRNLLVNWLATGEVNRAGFAGDRLLHFMRPYRARHAAHSSWLRPR
ncbi:hypothetical protein, partial [Loktanella atrilutea]|uniref:hypothetical protein n=1 Tax=Loktanella atrilutea TaxID=366533 RepID=UPI001C49CFEE